MRYISDEHRHRYGDGSKQSKRVMGEWWCVTDLLLFCFALVFEDRGV